VSALRAALWKGFVFEVSDVVAVVRLPRTRLLAFYGGRSVPSFQQRLFLLLNTVKAGIYDA
jgi:hypothetical protein